MIRERQLELVKEMDTRMIDILVSKSNDYASTEDVLGNFKRLSKVVELLRIDLTTAEGYALFMTLLKIDRITNLLNSGVIPSNESVDDSYADGINYFKLSYCCLKDKL